MKDSLPSEAEDSLFEDIREADNITLVRAELDGEPVAVIAAFDQWRGEVLLAPLAILATDKIKQALTPPVGMDRGYAGVIFRGNPHSQQAHHDVQSAGTDRMNGQHVPFPAGVTPLTEGPAAHRWPRGVNPADTNGHRPRS